MCMTHCLRRTHHQTSHAHIRELGRDLKPGSALRFIKVLAVDDDVLALHQRSESSRESACIRV